MSTHVPATVEGVLLFINTHKTKSEAEGLSAIYSFPVSDSAYPHVPQNIYGRLSSASSFPSHKSCHRPVYRKPQFWQISLLLIIPSQLQIQVADSGNCIWALIANRMRWRGNQRAESDISRPDPDFLLIIIFLQPLIP